MLLNAITWQREPTHISNHLLCFVYLTVEYLECGLFTADYILTNIDKLKNFIDPDFEMRTVLISSRVLTKSEMECVKNQKSIVNKSVELLNTLLEKSDDDRQRVLACLLKTGQKHVVNYIRGADRRKMKAFCKDAWE